MKRQHRSWHRAAWLLAAVIMALTIGLGQLFHASAPSNPALPGSLTLEPG